MEIAFVGFLESDGMPNLEEIGKKREGSKEGRLRNFIPHSSLISVINQVRTLLGPPISIQFRH